MVNVGCFTVLKSLRDDYGCCGIKVSFEDEGADLYEVLRLKEMCDRLEMELHLKIGGPEAIRDIKDAVKLGITNLVAPMIESPFAVRKFIDAAADHYHPHGIKPHLAINIETITAYENLLDILDASKGILSGITIGRGDFVCSMGLDRNAESAESVVVYDKIADALSKIKYAKFPTTMGGCISKKSKPFIAKLHENDLLGKFETRNVMFYVDYTLPKFEEAISKALLFEYKYLTLKRSYYTIVAQQDSARIESLMAKI